MNRMLWLSALLFTILLSSIASADYIRDFMSGPSVYSSTDMSEVEVNFADLVYVDESTNKIGRVDKGNGVFIEGEPIASAKLPRAYINIFSPYSAQASRGKEFKQEVLPSQIFGNDLTLSYIHPNGTPYTVALTGWNSAKPKIKEPSFGKDYEVQPQLQQIRMLWVIAKIIALSPTTHTDGNGTTREMKCIGPESCGGVRKRGKFVGTYDGFDQYNNSPSTLQSYYDNGPDEIREIDCFDIVSRARPNWFCTYTFPLNDVLLAELKFLDFRFHGDRKFARERIRTFKKLFCPIFHCDVNALKAAEITEGVE